MDFWDDDCLSVGYDDCERYASLLADQCAPLGQNDLAAIAALCEAAAAGPFLIDDEASGEGVVVATLPDGRHVVSLSSDRAAFEPERIRANGRLFCQARSWLVRLLRDRLRLERERESLLARVARLEAILARRGRTSVRSSLMRPPQPR